MKKKNYPKQSSLGFSVGDKVTIKDDPSDPGFYPNPGTIIGFLDDSRAANNGAALVDIIQAYGQRIKAYINTDRLVKVES